MNINQKKRRHAGLLTLLILIAILLAGRLIYFFCGDAQRFPLSSIQIKASYEHITHKELEQVLAKYLNYSFFTIPVIKLENELKAMPWVATATVNRSWPDVLKIKLTEKKPVAIWGDSLMTENGVLFNQGSVPSNLNLPHLKGPAAKQLEVLQVYKKLSKILTSYDLTAAALQLSNNQSWLLIIDNGAKIYLGKKELATRLERFCRSYPAVFAPKANQLASVDLRYPRGMAVQWKQQMGQ